MSVKAPTRWEVFVTRQPRPGSKFYRDDLRARLTAMGFAEEQITERVADDLVFRCGKRWREAWRLACDLSLDAVATRFNAAVGDPRAPMRKGRIWDYEQWPSSGTRPTIATLRTMAQVYGTSWDRLVDLDDLEQMSEEDRDAFHGVVAARRRNATMATRVTRLAVRPQEPEDDSSFRAALEDAAEESAQLATWAGTSNVDDDILEHMDRALRAAAHAYVYAAPYPLLLRTRRLRSRVVRLLRGRQRLPQTHDLYLIGARSCTMLAWITGDLGNNAAARDHAWAAWMCAQHANHDGARGWVRATQSKLAFWDGDFVESATLAADGQRYRAVDSAAVLLTLLEARAWARMGRLDDAETALNRWREARERIPGPDQVGGLLGLSEAQQHYLAGSTHLWLRQPTRALVETEQSISLFERMPDEIRFYGAEMIARVDSGRAHLQQGDLHAAIDAIDPVLAVDSDQRLETFVQTLGHFRTALALPRYRDNRDAQEAQEKIEEYCTAAAGKHIDLSR